MSKVRSLTSQLSGIFPYFCLEFSLGSISGYTTIVVGELYKKDSEIAATLDQLSWYASLSALQILSSITTGGLVDRFGSRLMGLSTALTFVISYLLAHYSTNIAFLLASGLTCYILVFNTFAFPYICEISEQQYRSAFLATLNLTFTLGLFFCQLLGSLLYWRSVALVNFLFPIAAAITVLFTPESPTWLANKGRLEEAEEALCWLRGWVQPVQVQSEFRALVDSVKQSSIASLEAAGHWTERLTGFFQQFAHPSFYLPFALISLMFTLNELSGIVVFFRYPSVIFAEIESPIERSTATAITGGMTAVGRLALVLVVRRVGKRKLACASAIVSAFCFLSMAIVGFLQLQGHYAWIPTIAMIVGSLSCNTGMGSIAYMLSSEIFPSSTRYLGTSMSLSISMLADTTMSISFFYIVEAVTLSATFLIFAIFNVVTFLVCCCFLLETEGKSLTEIKDHFKVYSKESSNQVVNKC